MSNSQKTMLVVMGTVLMAILSIFLLVSMNQISNTATTTNTVSFSGEGKVTAKPDIAVISFAILTESSTSKTAQDANSKKSNQVTDFLKKQGVEDKDIKTSGYNVYPQYSYPRAVPLLRQGSEGQAVPPSSPDYYDPNPKIIGYQVNQSFKIKIRDLDKVSSVLDGLVTAGANQVNNLGFQIDEPEKLKTEARAKAIADAKAKANQLKSQLGISLGRIINFSENSGGYPGPYYLEAKAVSDGSGGGGPSIPVGENEITINVTITYQIK